MAFLANEIAYHFAKVVDETAAGKNVHSREVFRASWVIMVAMDGENGNAYVQVWILEVDAPAAAVTAVHLPILWKRLQKTR